MGIEPQDGHRKIGFDTVTKKLHWMEGQVDKGAIDFSVAASAGGVNFKGDYDAATNTPDLDTSPSGVLKGDMYIVSVAGTFFTEDLQVGDSIISEKDDPTALADWVTIQTNLTAATIKTQYESNADTNAFTDTEQSKLGGIETSATADQTGAEIKTAYEAEPNAYTDTKDTKLTGIEAGAEVNDLTIPASTVTTQGTGTTPPNLDLEKQQSIFHSSGVITGGVITNDAGNPAISTLVGEIRATDDETATLLSFQITGSTVSTGVTDNAQNFVYAEYNAGSPQFIVTTTERTDFNTNVLLGTFFKAGSDLHINIGDSHIVGNHSDLMNQRLKNVMPFAREDNNGAVISETGTRNVAVSAGTFWQGLTKFTTAAFDSSAAGTWSYWYDDNAGGFTEVTAQTQNDNLQFDDGSGTLATLGNNNFGVHWVYLEFDGGIHVVYGLNDGDLQAAQDLAVPINIPDLLAAQTRLIGKIIIEENTAVFTETLSSFTTDFVGQAGLLNVVDDVTPQLGGNLDTQTFTVDSRDVSTDGSKLDLIEASATADQTGAEIKTAYEAEANAFTDAKNTKLTNIETLADVTDEANVKSSLDGATITGATVATGDKVLIQDIDDTDNLKTVTAQSIADLGAGGGGDVVGPASAVDENLAVFNLTTGKIIKDSGINQSAVTANTAKVTNANHTGDATGATALTIADNVVSLAKMADMATASLLGRNTAATGDPEVLSAITARSLLNVEDASTADQSDAEIKTAYENNADTNEFSDAEQSKLSAIEASATADQSDAEIETAYNAQVGAMSQATAEAGTSTTIERITAERIAQAIAKLTPVRVVFAISDETTALTTGVTQFTFRMPFAMTLTEVRASAGTAPTGSALTFDINETGVSILSTKLTIDATEKTSTTAATPAVISDSALADDAEIIIDIDTIGSTIAGAGAKITLIGTPT